MKKKAIGKRPIRNRRWLGVNDSGLYSLPNPGPVNEAREEWPGLPQAVQEALVEMNLEQDQGNTIPPKIVKALLACGEFFSCDLDAREEEL